jgi:hypothetical protein
MTVISVTKGIGHDQRNPPLQKHPRSRYDENAFLSCRQGCLRSQAIFGAASRGKQFLTFETESVKLSENLQNLSHLQ